MKIYSSLSTGAILGIIVGIIVVIAVLAYCLYRFLRPKLKEDKPSEQEILNEEMNRLLKPIDDDKTAKEVEKYNEDDDK